MSDKYADVCLGLDGKLTAAETATRSRIDSVVDSVNKSLQAFDAEVDKSMKLMVVRLQVTRPKSQNVARVVMKLPSIGHAGMECAPESGGPWQHSETALPNEPHGCRMESTLKVDPADTVRGVCRTSMRPGRSGLRCWTRRLTADSRRSPPRLLTSSVTSLPNLGTRLAPGCK